LTIHEFFALCSDQFNQAPSIPPELLTIIEYIFSPLLAVRAKKVAFEINPIPVMERLRLIDERFQSSRHMSASHSWFGATPSEPAPTLGVADLKSVWNISKDRVT
jgi:hypothetical protein